MFDKDVRRALIGTVAGEAGPAAWLAFLVAMVVAARTVANRDDRSIPVWGRP